MFMLELHWTNLAHKRVFSFRFEWFDTFMSLIVSVIVNFLFVFVFEIDLFEFSSAKFARKWQLYNIFLEIIML